MGRRSQWTVRTLSEAQLENLVGARLPDLATALETGMFLHSGAVEYHGRSVHREL